MTNAVDARGVGKVFSSRSGDVSALEGIDLSVAAGGADERDELPVGDAQVDAVEGHDLTGSGGEDFPDAAGFDRTHETSA